MDDVISKTETMKNNLNRQKYEIELLIKKVKDDGEELPPDLLAEFEKAKQNVLEINESIDDINASSLLHLWVFLYIHTKIPRFTGCLCSLSGIKIHFRGFLYDFALKRNKLLG